MSNPQYGKDTVLYFRLLKDAATKDGARLAYQIEHTINEERSNDVIDTKDGPIVNAGPRSVTIDLTAVSSLDEVNTLLYTAFTDDEQLEVWEVNLTAPGSGENKFKAKYMVGKLNSWALPAQVGSTKDISATLTVEQGPLEGEVTLTAEEQANIQTVFRDLPMVPGV